jgi:hypothetical protein
MRVGNRDTHDNIEDVMDTIVHTLDAVVNG